jgi:predicted metal-dependent peptidase
MYMPSSYSECTERITIGIDTSGSIGPNELQRFLSEVKVAVESSNPKVIDIIYWDYDVAAHETYEGDAVSLFADSTKPKGGGGTRVGAMKEYMTSHSIKPDCIIIFTEGYVENDFGGEGWPAPVLWCMTTKIVAPFGKTLQVTV